MDAANDTTPPQGQPQAQPGDKAQPNAEPGSAPMSPLEVTFFSFLTFLSCLNE